ncbi:MAG TPA: hypothetical protein VGP94_12875 [Tepidisphaeraceae bacterium]|jgi:hypothetical protein|nr:hypothetical protein [Tepidisphaeraceae bacterium]
MSFYKSTDLALGEFQRITEGGFWVRLLHTAEPGMSGKAGPTIQECPPRRTYAGV